MVSEMVSQTKVLNDMSRNIVKLAKTVEDMDHNLDRSINKLIRVIEYSNKIEVDRLRDIQVQKQLDAEVE